MTDQDLDHLRSEIRRVDKTIMDLVSERMQLARQVGEYKKERNLPIKDYRVEKHILELARQRAEQLNIYRDLASKIMQTLIEYSVVEQDVIKQNLRDAQSNSKKKVLVVGGAGNMGRWFSSFFVSLGFQLAIADNKTSEEFVQVDFEAINLDDYDWIVLATPMSSTSKILSQCIERKAKPLIIEICSLKSPVEETISKCDQSGLRVVSIHPMFGPDIEILSGRNIVFCHRPGFENAYDEVKQAFSQTSANLIDLDFNEHDRLMSIVLGAAHLSNLVFANLVKKSGFPLKKLETLAGTTFSNQTDVTRNVVRENQDLYYEIQTFNPETENLFKSMKDSTELLFEQIMGGKREDFKNTMNEASDYFKL